MAEKIKIGLLTIGDGRDFLKETLDPINERFQDKVKNALEGQGYEIVNAGRVIDSNRLAVEYGKMLRAADVDAVIINYCVWAWPSYARMAVQFCPQPVIMFSNYYEEKPGLVGMLAGAGSLDQADFPYFKLYGDIDDHAILEKMKSYIQGISAYNRLKGMSYVSVGGRSINIDTTVADPALWMKKFGIDVDSVDQMELVRRAEIIQKERKETIQNAVAYLEKHTKGFQWLDPKPGSSFSLTRESVDKAVSLYYGMIDLVEEFDYDFCGIKGQRELTEHYVTSDIAEAFLNDCYAPDGTPHDPVICATEADMDAALTMKIFNLISGRPVLFADIRNYYKDKDFWDLCNSGAHATYFAGASMDPAVNLANVEFRAEGDYYTAGGPSVYHIAKPGFVTLARLTRKDITNYRMVVMTGEFFSMGAEKDEEYARKCQDNWPHAFVKMNHSIDAFIAEVNCNHIHGTYGDHVEALRAFCKAADIEFVLLDGK
jgi:L-fucose isomerase